MSKIKIAILGSGNMGTAISHLLGYNGHEVSLWGIEKEVADNINSSRENKKSLAGIFLPDTVSATISLESCLDGARVVVVAVPTQVIREVLEKAKPYLKSEMIFLAVSKGIENTTGKTVSQIIKDNLPRKYHVHVGVLMGPLYGSEISQQIPSVGLVAIPKKSDFVILRDALEDDYFFVRYSGDVLGAELGGALKNIYAILLGVCDGLGYGWNAKSATLSAAISELSFCGHKLGAKKETLYGLAGLGDLLTTGFGEKSRNRRFGEKICSGETVEEVLQDIGQVVEGVQTLKIAVKLLEKYKKQTPLLNAVDKMVHKQDNPCKIFSELLKEII